MALVVSSEPHQYARNILKCKGLCRDANDIWRCTATATISAWNDVINSLAHSHCRYFNDFYICPYKITTSVLTFVLQSKNLSSEMTYS